MMFKVILFLPLLALTSAQDTSYLQYYSQRFYTKDAAPSHVAPFPTLSFNRALQISVRSVNDENDGGEQAFVLSEDGTINIVSSTGAVFTPGILPVPVPDRHWRSRPRESSSALRRTASGTTATS